MVVTTAIRGCSIYSILSLLRLDRVMLTWPFVIVRDESTTDFETDSVSEGLYIASPSYSARVQSRTEFANLGHVEWPAY